MTKNKVKNDKNGSETAKIAETIANTIWDVIVIGGGPAGMMAAGRAMEKAAEKAPENEALQNAPHIKTLLIEKNETLGKKLLITGGGRCNVTNAEFDNRTLLEKFKGDGKFLFSAFSRHSVKESLDFFNGRGMPTKVEANKRVFPVSNSALSVWDALVGYMKNGDGKNSDKKNGVTILSNSAVTGFVTEKNEKDTIITAVTLKGGEKIRGKSFILATGGKSHPETGSTGEGFTWLTALGHNVIDPSASLVPIQIRDEWVKKLAGVTLPEVKISLVGQDTQQTLQEIKNKKAKKSAPDRILFTHFGVSGPTILNMSRDIAELLEYDEDVQISLDLLPKHDYSTLNTALQELFAKDPTKKIKNVLPELVLSPLAKVVLDQAKINPDTTANGVSREDRLLLVKNLKDLRMHVEGLLGADKAIVMSGGVSLDEVDFKTMRSRLIPNLYLAGDILNIDRPSGGYSLQLCWTTGWVAGTSAAE